MSDEMKIKAIAPWFGANRESAASVGEQLGKLDWCGVPFVGGGAELHAINTRSGVACDLHRHIINLGRVVRDEALCDRAVFLLNDTLFHEHEFRAAQERCREREQPRYTLSGSDTGEAPDVQWAVDYFITAWMGPGASSGKSQEFTRYFSSRWSATGGASVTRFRSAVESLLGWSDVLKRWEFRVMDAFAFLAKCDDKAGHGVYCDPPWPDLGAEYKHGFSVEEHRKLALRLAAYKDARVVVRYGDHPLIRDLYPADKWKWIKRSTRNQANAEVAEVLIVNG